MSDTVPGLDFDLTGKRIWVAGHRGMVGQALVRRLEDEPVTVLTVGRNRVDLRNQAAVDDWMQSEKPDLIFLAAAKVGGILANRDYPAEFLYDNLMIEANIIHSAYKAGCEKLVFLGSSCIYPKLAPQPIPESALLEGSLEPTNEAYAIAKIAGIKMCQAYRKQYGCNFISAQPTNLYGPGDNFDLATSHVLPALIRKAHEAKQSGANEWVLWGSGTPLREFLHVDDLADALVFLARHYNGEGIVNVGTGDEVSIRQLAEMIADTVGYDGAIRQDTSKPDGTPRKIVDVSRLHSLGWRHRTALQEGIGQTYAWYLDNVGQLRGQGGESA